MKFSIVSDESAASNLVIPQSWRTKMDSSEIMIKLEENYNKI